MRWTLWVTMVLVAACEPDTVRRVVVVDDDQDGIEAELDCNDDDPTVGAISLDADCDGAKTAVDCDDGDPTVGSQFDDEDCDGAPKDVDCDDTKPALGSREFDADCDYAKSDVDCDDNDKDFGAIGRDADCDGVRAEDGDCDDNDPNLTPSDSDQDCDGIDAAIDCDDNDPTSNPIGIDWDCDGWLNTEECFNNSPGTVHLIADDADCDGVLTADDCDDNDNAVLAVADDADCDGALTVDDCDDSDTSIGAFETSPTLGTLQCMPVQRFSMGCDPTRDGACFGGEVPLHTVDLTRSVWIMEIEVTQSMWFAAFANNPSDSVAANRPVESISWWEAVRFANAMSDAESLDACYVLDGCSGTPGVDFVCTGITVDTPGGDPYACEGYRLPTEAEWEAAARGGEPYRYAGSDTLGDVAWWFGNVGLLGNPRVGCGKDPNGFELCDMTGNVYEWIWDWSTTYRAASVSDPVGDPTGSERIIRGGSHLSGVATQDELRVAFRSDLVPESRESWVGIRLVRTIDP